MLAGCSGGGGGGDHVAEETGSIRGVVVDLSITPVVAARITVSGGPNTTMNEAGEFAFAGLAPGYKLDGFYECTYATFFVTDSCDWVYRTGWDSVNESYGQPPAAPRSVQKFHNTQYIDVSDEAWAIVQEGFWMDSSVK